MRASFVPKWGMFDVSASCVICDGWGMFMFDTDFVVIKYNGERALVQKLGANVE